MEIINRFTPLNFENPINKGLVGYWPLNDRAGLTAFDMSLNKINGTLTNGPIWSLAGKFGDVLFFDNSDDYVEVGTNIITAAYTKTAWIYLDTAGSFHNIFSGDINNAHSFFASPTNALTAGNDTGFNDVVDPNTMSLDTWYFVAVTFDPSVGSGTMILYRDGVQVDSATSVPTHSLNGVVYIGAYEFRNEWAGFLSKIRLYNRVLRLSEFKYLLINLA